MVQQYEFMIIIIINSSEYVFLYFKGKQELFPMAWLNIFYNRTFQWKYFDCYIKFIYLLKHQLIDLKYNNK